MPSNFLLEPSVVNRQEKSVLAQSSQVNRSEKLASAGGYEFVGVCGIIGAVAPVKRGKKKALIL